VAERSQKLEAKTTDTWNRRAHARTVVRCTSGIAVPTTWNWFAMAIMMLVGSRNAVSVGHGITLFVADEYGGHMVGDPNHRRAIIRSALSENSTKHCFNRYSAK
jgi:hypothetical protein